LKFGVFTLFASSSLGQTTETMKRHSHDTKRDSYPCCLSPE
jgi:hypothetical protein